MIEQDNPEGMAEEPMPSFRLETLKKRQDFKDAAVGPRFSTPAFTMLRRPSDGPCGPLLIRFGFTATRKIGNSVERNRIRRRLREAVRASASEFPPIGMDLVILARRRAIDIRFDALVSDIRRAVQVLSTRDGRKPAKTPPPSKSGNHEETIKSGPIDEPKLGKVPRLGIEGA
jgi:ribonuclease P protein component